MDTIFIYALNCPITGRVRYVGKAKDPQRRFTKHLWQAKQGAYHRATWLRSLLALGQKPILEILDEVLESEWPQWEVAYIQFFREEGFDLTNGNAGGVGGAEPTPEVRAKIGARHRGNNYMLGKKHTLEARRKMSAFQVASGHAIGNQNCVGKKHSEAAKEKNRLAHLGKRPSEGTRAKMRASMRGLKRSEEARENMRTAWVLRRKKKI